MGVFMSRKEVMAVLGVGRDKLRTLAEVGVLEPVHLVIGEDGKPRDRGMYRREAVEAIVGKALDQAGA